MNGGEAQGISWAGIWKESSVAQAIHGSPAEKQVGLLSENWQKLLTKFVLPVLESKKAGNAGTGAPVASDDKSSAGELSNDDWRGILENGKWNHSAASGISSEIILMGVGCSTDMADTD